jgi:hypothetical protein
MMDSKLVSSLGWGAKHLNRFIRFRLVDRAFLQVEDGRTRLTPIEASCNGLALPRRPTNTPTRDNSNVAYVHSVQYFESPSYSPLSVSFQEWGKQIVMSVKKQTEIADGRKHEYKIRVRKSLFGTNTES